MAKVSIIVPSRNEQFLPQTVSDLLKNGGDIEVIAVLDGYWPKNEDGTFAIPSDERLRVIHFSEPRGMRNAINSAAAIATGKYLMKCDAHCLFREGYDQVLQDNIDDNWVVIPRRYSLDADNWACAPKEPVDYEHLFYPYEHPDDLGLHARVWRERGRQRKDIDLDEDMSFQGSCWFMHAKHFHERLGGLDDAMYGAFWSEPQEIGFKTQLGRWEGKLMRNKMTYYAHLHKGKRYGRGYHQAPRTQVNAFAFDYWWNNRWEERAHDIQWMIERFMPVPGWPQNWRELHFG